MSNRDFPGGPVVKNPPCNTGNVSSVPSRRMKIPLYHGATCNLAASTEPVNHNQGVCVPQWKSARAATETWRNQAVSSDETHRAFLPWAPIRKYPCSKSESVVMGYTYGYFCLFVLPHHTVCGILVPWPRIEPSLAVKAWSPNHRTAREFAVAYFLRSPSKQP